MDVFSIVGPVMIGPSSSHTAGAVRLGNIAEALLGKVPTEAEIVLYGSFAQTFRGHGTDKAILSGIMGFGIDDERLKDSFKEAEKIGLNYHFKACIQADGRHPNTAHITLKDEEGRVVEMEGASVGGGNILITQVNGLEVHFNGEFDTLIVLHRDVPGVVANVTQLLTENAINICRMQLNRAQRGGDAVMTIEVDGKMSAGICSLISEREQIQKCILCRKID
ncbi:MAG: L-serine ammonia-lyase, iron-sulfur-dependent subunit beta [Lachnospiraceae bacterium]|nr:L-serine ammonia-lyase, iron-sulfur-dependent subunit beta [Lachnospiraceae bacterium]